MIFLADESVDFPIIQLLRHHKFYIVAVIEKFPSREDEFVLDFAQKEGRLLITSDKDFGELVYRLKKVSAGVILLRIEELTPSEKADFLWTVIAERKEELKNAFTVVRKDMIRIRKL
jgi:predicted nuclease of predicted toxin-antitoxin system